jgi:hypothetical protein
MENILKSAKWTKGDMPYGALCGILTAENEVDYEMNGTIQHAKLTGNVRPCETNNVIITGRKISEDTIEVHFMESFETLLETHKSGLFLQIPLDKENANGYALVFDKKMVKDETPKESPNGGEYTSVHVVIDKEVSAYISIYKGFTKDVHNGVIVCLATKPLTSQEKDFGAIKKTTHYGSAVQVYS